MNKRSAMLMAAGLVLTVIVAGVAIAAGLTGPAASAAAPRAVHHRDPKPIVKTIRKTVTVHKKAPQAPAAPVTYAAAPAPMAPPAARSISYPSAAPASPAGYVDDGGYQDGGSHSGGGGDD